MKNLKLLLIGFLLILLQSVVFAGAWTQKQGSYYLKFEASYLKTFKEFNHKGDELNILEEQFIFKEAFFRDISIRAYAEYGLFNNLTIVGKLPIKISTSGYFLDDLYSQGDVSRTTTGLGDLNLALKYGVLTQPVAVAVQGGLKVPLGYEKHPDNGGPQLGSGEIDLQGKLELGLSLHPLPMYLGAGIGYHNRGGALHDEIVYHFETGYTLKKWFFKLYFNGIKNTIAPPDLYGDEIQLPLPGGGGITPDYIFGDIDLNQISFTLSREIKEGMSVEATVYHILSGKNTISGQTFSLGVALFK